ncbi:uncharacterized protein [Littorina saxatilis]|uniref:uncharacterized protein n=1 Tax=Littorina saxatilis TaxID=31220 RepID=UPI0038B5B7B5
MCMPAKQNDTLLMDGWVDGSTIEAAEAEPQQESGTQLGLFILGGVVGLVLLIVIVLSICVGVLFWKRGRPRRLPPPPAPHHVRRAACDRVVVHAARRDSRVSSDCSQGNEYAEIQDDTDLSRSESSLASLPMSTVSDSSMSDCLHHIACPSSDSSLPEDYLNPVASFGGTAAIVNSNDDNSNSSSSSEAVMYAEERITFKKKVQKESKPCTS